MLLSFQNQDIRQYSLLYGIFEDVSAYWKQCATIFKVYERCYAARWVDLQSDKHIRAFQMLGKLMVFQIMQRNVLYQHLKTQLVLLLLEESNRAKSQHQISSSERNVKNNIMLPCHQSFYFYFIHCVFCLFLANQLGRNFTKMHKKNSWIKWLMAENLINKITHKVWHLPSRYYCYYYYYGDNNCRYQDIRTSELQQYQHQLSHVLRV